MSVYFRSYYTPRHTRECTTHNSCHHNLRLDLRRLRRFGLALARERGVNGVVQRVRHARVFEADGPAAASPLGGHTVDVSDAEHVRGVGGDGPLGVVLQGGEGQRGRGAEGGEGGYM